MLVVATPAMVARALALFKEYYEVARVKNRFSPEAPLYGKQRTLLDARRHTCNAYWAHAFL